MDAKVKQLALKNITADPSLQMRDKGLNERLVDEYADAMTGGAEFPPPVVYHDNTGTNWLSQGFHRHAAAMKAGLKTIAVEMRSGTRADALIDAAGSNATHGLKRTNADKRRAASQVITEFPDMPNTQIADIVGVSDTFVGDVKKRLQRIKDGLSVKPDGSAVSGPDEEDDEAEILVNSADAGKAVEVIRSVVRRAHRVQEDISGLLTGAFAAELRNLAESYTGCKFYDTGEPLQRTFHGGTTVSIPKWSNDALDNLLGFCGGAKQMLAKIEAKPVGEDAGERLAPWEVKELAESLRGDDDTVEI